MKRKYFQIAIDGPVGAGKSTVAKILAERLKFLYVDTGAMYRAVALAAQRKGVGWSEEADIIKVAQKVKIRLARPLGKRKDGRNITVYLGKEDVSWEIRSGELGEGASMVSKYPMVRKLMVEMQRRIAEGHDVIMEGRDIGTRVLPKAQLKIYLDANLSERVQRKKEQLVKLGERKSVKEVRQEVVTRDQREMTRKVDPLRPAEGAWILDTTGLSVSQVVDIINRKVEAMGRGF